MSKTTREERALAELRHEEREKAVRALEYVIARLHAASNDPDKLHRVARVIVPVVKLHAELTKPAGEQAAKKQVGRPRGVRLDVLDASKKPIERISDREILRRLEGPATDA